MAIEVEKIDFSKHFSGNNHDQMRTLINPLANFGIIGLKHFRIYDDNSGVNFTTLPEYLDIFVKYKLWREGCVGDFKDYTNGYFFWDDLPSAAIFQAAAEYCKVGNGITIIKKHEKFVDQFFFFAELNNPGIKNFYLNHMDVIEKFLAYYYIEAKQLLDAGKNHSYIFPGDKKEVSQIINHPNYIEKNISDFDLFIAKNLKNKFNRNKFTKRELEVIMFMSSGYSTKIVAQNLNISAKTVEHHLENARAKVGARNIVELCLIAAKFEIYQ